MRTALLLLGLLAIPAHAAQTVWKWVDDQGVTHYSDRPVPGATKVEIASSNRAQPFYPSTPRATPEEEEPAATPGYRTFEIAQPAEGDVIINTGGRVAVTLDLQPALKQGHTISVYLDGRRVEDFPPGETAHEITEVPRGVHTLRAEITDRAGGRVQQAGPITFYVRQTSIAQPPVGPALRPPPKTR